MSQVLELIQKQQKQIERLQQMVQQQQEEIEYLKRIGKRQATPFARRHWVEKPRRPGRKAGTGEICSSRIAESGEDQRDERSETAGLSGVWGHLQAIRKHEQFVTDIPVVEVKTTQLCDLQRLLSGLSQTGPLACIRSRLRKPRARQE